MKNNIIFFVLLFCVCLLIGSSVWASLSPHIKQFSTIKQNEPSYADILFAYFKDKGITTSSLERLKKRVKAAPYFPALYVGYDHSLTEREGLKVSDNISLSGGDVTIGPEDNDYNYYGYLGRTVHARAVWKLDEIIFNRNHLLIESERRELLKLQKTIGDDLYKIYEDRYLYLIRYLQAKGHLQSKAMYYAKYLSLTDRIDAITGGQFHDRWWREQKQIPGL
ncbi:MAG: hypothetical protein ACD_62C00544G0013 [uncultured bacterium]|nr:MAG: hypothetical protein ACD_62C00544G0013 [uncultured bacterium]HLD46045.1 hypothetical protein [bacterium]